jgi:tripartite-type tricarboxylate transporter receptor subunit TctC
MPRQPEATRRRVVMGVAAIGSLVARGLPVLAQANPPYPTRPIRIVVGFGPGGGNDLLARLIGQKLAERLGQAVVVENKPGAGAIIATEYVARAVPDGYTLLLGATGAMTVNPAVYAKLPYDLRDFAPIHTRLFPAVALRQRCRAREERCRAR